MLCFYTYEPGRHRIDTGNVLVEHGKHMTRYWPASTPEEFAASCAHILKQRVKDNEYQEWGDAPTFDTDKNPLTQEQIDALPEGPVRKLAEQQVKNIADRIAEYKRHNKNVQAVKRIVESDDIAKLIEVRHRKTQELLRYETLASRALDAFNEGYHRITCESMEKPDGLS